jgi:hypothetical protein
MLFGSELEFWVTFGWWMMVKCGDWGCRPNQDCSHINIKHIQGVWQLSYAVDVHMDVSLSLPHYGCSSSSKPSKLLEELILVPLQSPSFCLEGIIRSTLIKFCPSGHMWGVRSSIQEWPALLIARDDCPRLSIVSTTTTSSWSLQPFESLAFEQQRVLSSNCCNNLVPVNINILLPLPRARAEWCISQR